MIGQIVGGRYRITGVLGEGGMGVVYIGEQQMGSTVRKVAIKTLHPHLSKDPSVLARFHRECGTVAQLEHPNTIKFYDFGSTADGTLYIAMEFVKGEPLMDVIEKGGPMPPDRVLKIMKQICGALDEAHKQGIIHRDLKPENVILTDRAGEKDFVKVLDFGIAARSESSDAQKEQKLTQQGMVLGTPPYMSPEQFTGKALDMRSDIYSLGVMTYEMLTARLPFEADTPWQWATQHMTAQPLPFEATAPATNIPEQMRKAILRALSKDKRGPSAQRQGVLQRPVQRRRHHRGRGSARVAGQRRDGSHGCRSGLRRHQRRRSGVAGAHVAAGAARRSRTHARSPGRCGAAATTGARSQRWRQGHHHWAGGGGRRTAHRYRRRRRQADEAGLERRPTAHQSLHQLLGRGDHHRASGGQLRICWADNHGYPTRRHHPDPHDQADDQADDQAAHHHHHHEQAALQHGRL